MAIVMLQLLTSEPTPQKCNDVISAPLCYPSSLDILSCLFALKCISLPLNVNALCNNWKPSCLSADANLKFAAHIAVAVGAAAGPTAHECALLL